MNSTPTRRRVLLAISGALAGAAILLVTVVLPAEYGFDPLGTGAKLGLTGLAASTPGIVQDADLPPRTVQLSLELDPFESVEVKFHLDGDFPLLFAWRADGELIAELHGEPDTGSAGRAQAFQSVRSSARQGSLRVPFAGWHGWYWENRSGATVRLDLEVYGFTGRVREYRGGRIFEWSPADGQHPASD
ncbi:MAG: hypothetical protein KF911_10055 [Pseudomonadales bacterium]|nr:hypothetical protein [Pseudomonadales bacterium]